MENNRWIPGFFAIADRIRRRFGSDAANGGDQNVVRGPVFWSHMGKRYLRKLHTRGFFLLHKVARRFGVHLLPIHFYSPVPNKVELERTREVWARKSELPGIKVDLDAQLERLKTVCHPFREEFIRGRIREESLEKGYGAGFGRVESQVLYAFIRYSRPRRIVEVGSGSSTYCSLKALERNREEYGDEFELHCIEPFPSRALRQEPGIRLSEVPVQIAGTTPFMNLRRGDMLFIDSTHTVKPGGDVNFLIMEILPRLNSGVCIHFHDIYLPYDYQPNVLETMFFWYETTLLRSFLIMNRQVEIVFCLSQLHYERQPDMVHLFPGFNPREHRNGLISRSSSLGNPSRDFPTSIYLEMV